MPVRPLRGMTLRAFALATVVASGVLGFARLSHAADDDFDDPKLSREGVTPAPPAKNVPPPATAPDKAGADKAATEKAAAAKADEKTAPQTLNGEAAHPAPPAASAEKPSAPKTAIDVTAAKPVLPKPDIAKPDTGRSSSDKEAEANPPAPVGRSGSTAAAPAGASADLKAVAAPPAVASGSHWPGPWPYAPRLKLAYRRFPFARIASVTADGVMVAPGSESFESLSIDTYPMSSYLRVGLSTQFGWESGQFQRTGDYFLAESASVGFQIPGRYTPFVETLAGAGYMRRRQAESNLPTAYWQVGVDVGVELYFASRAYGSIAIGYLHPANLFYAQRNLQSMNLDTWSLKLGIGI
ncbi:MAG TPA: hypothetical protein VHU40_14685 [Polyangia bacterium]|nr:hypothetical protein [Polyangia bacterium]